MSGNFTVEEEPTRQKQLASLIGDLSENAPDGLKKEAEKLLNKAENLRAAREAECSYEMQKKELRLWKQMNGLLNEDTTRQFGEEQFSNDDSTPSTDNGKIVVDDLKKILNDKDWLELNAIRNRYFAAMEKDSGAYDGDAEIEEAYEPAA